ncbi:MAG TPA: DMT family transporter [Gaiellaceae bacterium]|nr:DMT family transporter [Gaiellaceae bacterium]
MLVLVLLLAVTAVWGLTFVQVKDAVEVYPLFAFLALRFAIATATLAPAAGLRLRTLRSPGVGAGVVLGGLLALGYALQTAGLALTTVSAAGFVTGLYVVLTPVFALLLFRVRIGRTAWGGVALATVGLALLSGVESEAAAGDLLVLGGAAAFALQIVFMERWAPRFDVLALTLAEMATAFLGFLVIALALGQLSVPRGWTVWSALLVTGVFASALAFLVQTWAQRRTTATRVAVVFAMEPVFAALFGVTLAGDRLGWVGWAGCAVIMGGIALAEPAAGDALGRLLRRRG